MDNHHSRRLKSFPLYSDTPPRDFSGNDLSQHIKGERRATIQSTTTPGPDFLGVPDRRIQRRYSPYPDHLRQPAIGLPIPVIDFHSTDIVSDGSIRPLSPPQPNSIVQHKADHLMNSQTLHSQPPSSHGLPWATTDPLMFVPDSMINTTDFVDLQGPSLKNTVKGMRLMYGDHGPQLHDRTSNPVPSYPPDTNTPADPNWGLSPSVYSILTEHDSLETQERRSMTSRDDLQSVPLDPSSGARSSASLGRLIAMRNQISSQIVKLEDMLSTAPRENVPPATHTADSPLTFSPAALLADLQTQEARARQGNKGKRQVGSSGGAGDRVPNISPSLSGLDEGSSHVNQLGSSLFSGAHDFVIRQPTFVETGIPPLTSELKRSEGEALQWIEGYIMEGAEFDSVERDPPPRCHAGTRTSIIEQMHQWIGNPHRGRRLLWLLGPAGVGKSAIVQTLAEALSKPGRLGASLFFSRPNGRSNPQQVFPTIAYQLALQDASYKAYINELMLSDPRSLNKSMQEQFRVLITEPFGQRKLCSGQADLLVAIDGLDECDGEAIQDLSHSLHYGLSYENAQCEIVRLVSGFVQQYPLVPLIWIIASRPEAHLKAIFSASDIKDSFIKEDIPVDSDEACRDTETYLHASFVKICKQYPDHCFPTPWPSNAHFLQIAHAALGLFVSAEVIIRFIEDPQVGDPIAQLRCVLAAIAKPRFSKQGRNPFDVLDAIYNSILNRIPDPVITTTKRLLQSLVYCQRRRTRISDFTFGDMCKYLMISHEDAITAVRHLHSVVFFPRAYDIVETRPRFYHASFVDYLENPSRSREYALDEWKFDPDRLLQIFLPQLSGRRGNTDDDTMHYTRSSYNLLARILESKELLSPSGLSIDLVGTRCLISEQQLDLLFEHFEPSGLLDSANGLELMNEKLQLHKDRVWTDELKRRGYLSIGTLDSISKPPKKFHVTGYATTTFCIAFDYQRRYTGEDIDLPFLCGQLSRLYLEEPKTKILLWGRHAGRQCAMIQKENLPEWWRNGRRGTVYICGFSTS